MNKINKIKLKMLRRKTWVKAVEMGRMVPGGLRELQVCLFYILDRSTIFYLLFSSPLVDFSIETNYDWRNRSGERSHLSFRADFFGRLGNCFFLRFCATRTHRRLC
jgi:hypothetical protein